MFDPAHGRGHDDIDELSARKLHDGSAPPGVDAHAQP